MKAGRRCAIVAGAVLSSVVPGATAPALAQAPTCGNFGPMSASGPVGYLAQYTVTAGGQQQMNITLQWGDGSQSNGSVTTGQSTTLSHTYMQAGTFSTLVTVSGTLQGGAACSTSVPGTVTITGPPPPPPAQPPPAQPPTAPAPAPDPAPAPAPPPAPPPLSLLDPANPLNPNNTLRANQAFIFPSTKRCVSKRNFQLRIVRPKLVTYVSAKVTVNGKQVPVIIRRERYTTIRGKVLKQRRFTARVDLRGLTKGRFRAAITAYTQTLVPVVGVRNYQTCSGKERGGKPRV